MDATFRRWPTMPAIAFLVLMLLAQPLVAQGQQAATVTRGLFGRMPSGKAVEIYSLTNRGGMQVRAITYGAIIQSIRVPDKTGLRSDVTLG